jgi:hypothetical protein
MRCEKVSRSEQKSMSATVYVDRARGMARFLEDREAHAVGDRELARKRIEQRYGIAGSMLYSLRYRPPKQIAADIYAKLCTAVEDVAQRQIKILEIEIAQARESHDEIRQTRAAEIAAVLDEMKR